MQAESCSCGAWLGRKFTGWLLKCQARPETNRAATSKPSAARAQDEVTRVHPLFLFHNNARDVCRDGLQLPLSWIKNLDPATEPAGLVLYLKRQELKRFPISRQRLVLAWSPMLNIRCPQSFLDAWFRTRGNATLGPILGGQLEGTYKPATGGRMPWRCSVV